MANSVTLSVSLDDLTRTFLVGVSTTQKSYFEVPIAAGAIDQEVKLNLTSPRLLVIANGAQGITYRWIASTGTPNQCNPLACLVDQDGFTQSSIFISNGGSLQQILQFMVGG